MILAWMFLAVLVLLLAEKYLEDRLGEEEKLDLIKVETPKRGQFTKAGGRANK